MAATNLISTLTHTELADTVERVFYGGPDLPQVKDMADAMSLYMVDYIPNGVGSQKVYDEIDSDTYAHYKAEGADATKNQTIAGYTKTMYARRFAAEIDITYEANNWGKEQSLVRKLTSLATFCPARLALDLTHRFTFMTATSYTDMDGESIDVSMGNSLAMVYASQTVTGSSSTYSTVITGNPQFSQGGFEVARAQANTQVVNNFYERRVLNFNTVVTGDDPGTVREVRQLLNSTADITGAHAGIMNAYAGMFKHVILPRLATSATGAYDSTKVKYWLYMAIGEWQGRLGIWEAPHLKMPAPSNNGEDVHNDNLTFGARMGYGICVPSPLGALGSTGAGA